MINRTAKETIEKAMLYTKSYEYIYGYKDYMNPVSKSWIEILSTANPQMYTAEYKRKALEKVGKSAIDCSGLVCECVGLPEMNSTSIRSLPYSDKNYTYVNRTKLQPGDICGKKGHVGLYVGSEKVVEARSMAAGVHEFALNSQPWTEFIHPYYKTDETEEYSKTGWIFEPDGRCWYAKSKKKGDYYKSGIYKIDGKEYLFDSDGYLIDVLVIMTAPMGNIDTKVIRHWAE